MAGTSNDPEPSTFETKIFGRGLRDERPRYSTDSTNWEGLAHARLPADAWAYVHGSAGQRETDDKNRAAFRKWSIVPRRLVDMRGRMPDLSVTVFGQRMPFPVALAPVGVQTIFHRHGELASSRAAGREKVPFIFSSASSTSPEAVAEANGADALYWPGNQYNHITKSILERAMKAGYTALFVTLDTYMLGWRPDDMDNGYNPFIRPDHVGVEVGMTSEEFRKHFFEANGKTVDEDVGSAAREWMKIEFPGFSHVPEDVKFLQSVWKGPIVLKGIQSVADAKLCVELGVQGIVVSNHGGRQQDGGNGSLTVLPKIVDAVGDQLEVFFDSGIRCGADIVKALGLGAKMCLLGRPYVYGLAFGGEEGVRHVIKSTLVDIESTLHMAGVTSVQKDVLNRDVIKLEEEL